MPTQKEDRLVVPLQPGIATEIFRRCLTEPFARAFGVEVSTPARSERFLQDVQEDVEAGGHQFDVVEWPQLLFTRAKRLGLCEPLDYNTMPSLNDMHPRYLDPDGFGVGVFVWGMVLVYNPRGVRRPPQRWADLWAPEFRGQIALRNQLAPGQLMAITCKVLGIPTEGLIDEATFKRAWRKLEELKPQVRVWANSEAHVQELMAMGAVPVAQQFIDVAQIQKDRGVAIEIVFPEEGPIWGYRSWTIVKGSRRPELAREFINFSQAAEQQKALAETFYGHPVNRKVSVDEALIPRIYGGWLKDPDLSFPDWEWYLRRPDVEARWRRLLQR